MSKSKNAEPEKHGVVSPVAGFLQARPVWPRGRAAEKNLFVGFRAVITVEDPAEAVLRVAGHTVYRAFVNGVFCGYGPARGPHGWFRVDEWPLAPLLKKGRNVVSIEVAGYNVNSFYLLEGKAFLQAEVVVGGKILAATGRGRAFVAGLLAHRVQKVQRFSFQRPFSEIYRLAPGVDAWRTGGKLKPVPLAAAAEQPLLSRGVPYSDFTCGQPVRNYSHGRMKAYAPERIYRDRCLTNIGPTLGGYVEQELESIPYLEIQNLRCDDAMKLDRAYAPDAAIGLQPLEFEVLDFGTNLTGFIGLEVACPAACRLFLQFDEILKDGDVQYRSGDCVNLIELQLAKGLHRFEAFEPYTLRYLKLLAVEGRCEIRGVYLRGYVNPAVRDAHFAASDDRLNRVFEAGRETFRQNALDVFMDCPSRERAGWLCDSFFTARAAQALSGNAAIERNFFENFLLPKKFPHLPDGMLPMCYPSDHNDGWYLPNWALWFVVELEEYLARSGDQEMIRALEPRVRRLFQFFEPFLNSHGLLEKLTGWVFVEWSRANEFVQDVNYPTNMLYAAALAAAGRMYRDRTLVKQANVIREVIRNQSFIGGFFMDNAVRENGYLKVTRNHTETCQYYAFFFETATPERYPDLWKTLCESFGPKRNAEKEFPEVPPSNAFIGVMLRLELLSRHGLIRQMMDESVDYWLTMADQTGTLWEHLRPEASCCHGFTSHVTHVFYRDVLGLRDVDGENRTVTLRFSDLPLEWCRGRMPVPGGAIELSWEKKNGELRYRLTLPAGYRASLDSASLPAVMQ